MKTKKATFAIYKTREETKTAIRALRRLGFKNNDLSVLQPIRRGDQDFPQVQRNQIENGAIFGAILGAFIAGTVYLFLGRAENVHATVLDGNVVQGGLAVFSAVLLGAIAGAACGALVGIGTPEPIGHRYGQYLHSGGILLSVRTDDPAEADRAEQILSATGGHDVHVADSKLTWDSAIMKNIEISHRPSSIRPSSKGALNAFS